MATPKPTDTYPTWYGSACEVFPTHECVVACSGPSLKLVDPWAPGLPVVGISTAVRYPTVAKPNVWVIADRVNAMHGPRGNELLRDPDVVVVTPVMPNNRNNGPNCIRIEYSRAAGYDRQMSNKDGRYLFDGKLPLFRDRHKSIILAIQWLHYVGVRKAIICGCDLDMSRDTRYAYTMSGRDRNALKRQPCALQQTQRALERLFPLAKQAGLDCYSWSPGTKLDNMLPIYEGPHARDPETDPAASRGSADDGTEAGDDRDRPDQAGDLVDSVERA
jgi:hypothetical protein